MQTTTCQITFASANLFNFITPPNAFYDFEHIYTKAQWQDKLSWTEQQIKQLNPDVIGVQEIFSLEDAKFFFHRLGYPHFVTLDTPIIERGYIHSHPVVAMASRYPITQIESPLFDSKSLTALDWDNIEPPSFSRQPVCAQLLHPNIGPIRVYVTHLKSQRPADLLSMNKNASALPSRAITQWVSTQQRGWEAAMLRDCLEKKYQQSPMPTVLMGDFNQSINEHTVNGVLLANHLHKTDDKALTLYDGWELQINRPTYRPATHYYGVKGSLLDYILLSQEFNHECHDSIAKVVDYQVLDKHLLTEPAQRDHYASDHAFIALTAEFHVS